MRKIKGKIEVNVTTEKAFKNLITPNQWTSFYPQTHRVQRLDGKSLDIPLEPGNEVIDTASIAFMEWDVKWTIKEVINFSKFKIYALSKDFEIEIEYFLESVGNKTIIHKQVSCEFFPIVIKLLGKLFLFSKLENDTLTGLKIFKTFLESDRAL